MFAMLSFVIKAAISRSVCPENRRALSARPATYCTDTLAE
jgi:hypothetical protein